VRERERECVCLFVYLNKNTLRKSYSAFSYSTIKPMVLSQSYFFASPLSVLGVTTTARGITNKQFLCKKKKTEINKIKTEINKQNKQT